MSFWALLPAAASLAGTLLSRPKKKDYIYDTGYMDKYINNLRGQRLDSQISHMIMQPALRAIGQQGARFSRQTDYYTARRKPGGGVEAQMRLSGSQQALEAIGIAGEKAFFAQYKENRRIGDLLGRIEMEKGRYEAIGKREYSRARSQWGREVITSGLTLAANVGASIAATKKADIGILDKAKSLDLIDDDMTLKEFQQMGANRGFENMSMFVNQLARKRGIDQALNVYDPSNIPPREEIEKAVREGKISPEYGRELIEKTFELQREIKQFKQFNVMDTDIITEEYIIEQVEKGLDPKKGQELMDVVQSKKKLDKYVGIYAKGMIALKESREIMPENMAGRFSIIDKMDLPATDKAKLYEEEIKFSNKLLTSFQKNVYGEFFDISSDPSNILNFLKQKGTSLEEAKWIAGLYVNKMKMKADRAKINVKEYGKVAEGTAISQLVRHRLLKSQPKLVSNPAFKYVVDLLDIKSYADLVSLGQNLAGVQDRIAKLAEVADIPGTLERYSELTGTYFTDADIALVKNYNSMQTVKYLKQRWQDDLMDEIYKALKAVGFPGVMDPETFLGITSVGVMPQMVRTPSYENEIPKDLTIWE